MHHPTTFSLILLPLLITFLTLVHIPKSLCQFDQQYVNCSQPFTCGNLNFSYPFWGWNRPSYCGHPEFKLTCENNEAILVFESLRYRVLYMDFSYYQLRVARDDLRDNLCPRIIRNTTIANFSSLFSPVVGYRDVTLSYGCNISASAGSSRPQNQFDCEGNSSTASTSFFSINGLGLNPAQVVCSSSISVPVTMFQIGDLENSTYLQEALQEGFLVQAKANNSKCDECSGSGGRCGYNSSSNSFICFCSDRPYDFACELTGMNSPGLNHPLIIEKYQQGIVDFYLLFFRL